MGSCGEGGGLMERPGEEVGPWWVWVTVHGSDRNTGCKGGGEVKAGWRNWPVSSEQGRASADFRERVI